jgi:C-terminal processing protease CtpA/Prc
MAALAASSALGQQQEQASDQASSQSASQSEQQNQEQERQRQQQEQQRAEQQRQQEQQDRQRNEQDEQSDDQDQQNDQQDRQTSQREQQAQQRDRQIRQRDRQDRNRDQQDAQRERQSTRADRQDRQSGAQSRQRNQQIRQWSQQDRQRTGQARSNDERFRGSTEEQWSRFPEPSGRQQYSRDTQRSGQDYDISSQRQSRQFGEGGDDQDAGLGVNVVSEGGEGVTVVRVFQDTPAEQMGLREGDRITEVNGEQVRSTQEFISRIRNMNPGDEVQLAVDREREEYIVSGQLESREEALARNQQQSTQSGQQDDLAWQTGYEERGGYQQQGQGRIARGGDQDGRIQQIEQRIDRLNRELQQLRYSLQELRQGQGGRSGERQAGYDEYQGGYQRERFGTRQSGQSDQWDGQSGERSQRTQGEQGIRSNQRIQRGGSQFDSDQGAIQSDGFRTGPSDNWSQGGYRSDDGGSDSPGGVTGGLRTRPDNDPNWERR